MHLTDQQIEGLDRLRIRYSEGHPNALRFDLAPFHSAAPTSALTVIVYDIIEEKPLGKHYVSLGGITSPRYRPDFDIPVGAVLIEDVA